MTAEQIKQALARIERYKTYIFICNPSEKISKADMPDGVRLIRSPFCELGKGYLVEDDPYKEVRSEYASSN